MKAVIITVIVSFYLYAFTSDPIIDKLNSPVYSDRIFAINQIVNDNLTDYIPELETRINDQEDIWIQFKFLEALYKLNSPLTHQLALQFLQDTFVKPAGPHDIYKLRLLATEILFKLNDYSMFDYVYQYYNRISGIDAIAYLSLLVAVADNVPSEKENIINRLEGIILDDLEARPYCFPYLVELDSLDGLNAILAHTTNEPSELTRIVCLKLLAEKYEYSLYADVFKNAIYNEPQPEYRRSIANIIVRHGSPSNVRQLLDYIQFEPDSSVAISITRITNYFMPSKPDLNESYQFLFNHINDLLEECYEVDMVEDQAYDDINITLEDLRNYFGDEPYDGACETLNAFIDYLTSQKDSGLLTRPGWSFLYFNSLYIMEKMNNDNFPCELEE